MVTVFKNEIPNWIEYEDSYLFHGTSNISELKLDEGLTASFSFVNQGLVKKILTIYDNMQWYGIHTGGYAVLCSFSITDLDPIDGKLFFLGETIKRCSLYASKDFAGGELVRSVFYSINDLIKYINDFDLREEHKIMLELNAKFTTKRNQYNLESLSNEIKALYPLFEEVKRIRNSYNYGIVYCYKIEESDYRLLEHRGGMGILAKAQMPIEKLRAKIVFDDLESCFYLKNEDKLRIERCMIWRKRIDMFNLYSLL